VPPAAFATEGGEPVDRSLGDDDEVGVSGDVRLCAVELVDQSGARRAGTLGKRKLGALTVVGPGR
jgi:hypothetical protein